MNHRKKAISKHFHVLYWPPKLGSPCLKKKIKRSTILHNGGPYYSLKTLFKWYCNRIENTYTIWSVKVAALAYIEVLVRVPDPDGSSCGFFNEEQKNYRSFVWQIFLDYKRARQSRWQYRSNSVIKLCAWRSPLWRSNEQSLELTKKLWAE